MARRLLECLPDGPVTAEALCAEGTGSGSLEMRPYTVHGKLGATLGAVLAVAGFATAALAQSSPVPRIISSSETDTGSTEQPYLSMTLPEGVVAGQLLLAMVAIQGSNPVVDPWGSVILPAGGWTEITTLPNACGLNETSSGPNLAMSIAWRIATSTDVPGTEFTWGFLSDGFLTPVVATGAVVSIANVNTSTPIEQITPSNCQIWQDKQTVPTAQAMTTLNSNDMNMLVFGITGNNNMNTSAGYSLISQHEVFGIGPDLLVESKLIPAIYTNTGTQEAPAETPGDSLGYQIDLVPEGSSTTVSNTTVSNAISSNTTQLVPHLR